MEVNKLKKIKRSIILILLTLTLFTIQTSILTVQAGWTAVESWTSSGNDWEGSADFIIEVSESKFSWTVSTDTDCLWVMHIDVLEGSIAIIDEEITNEYSTATSGEIDFNKQGQFSIELDFSYIDESYGDMYDSKCSVASLSVQLLRKTEGIAFPTYWFITSIFMIGIASILVRKTIKN